MLNRVILMGRLVADPELKTTNNGINVTSFRIAVERSYVKAGAQREANFIDVVCWRNTADFVCRYFSKGSLIALEGQLQTRTYQAKDGTNRYVVEVVADNVSFTGERRDQQPGGYSQGYNQSAQPDNRYAQSAPSYQQPEPAYTSGSANDFEDMPLDDDLPF